MSDENTMGTIPINYIFKFESGEEKEFKIQLNSETLDLTLNPKYSHPEWTELNFSKCTNCPLDQSHKHCPIAVNLVDIIDFFGKIISYKETDIVVETSERNFSKHTDVQTGVTSLIGIYMVTSGCPVMDKLRPMVRFHLPFASIEETTYRSISMYLFVQHFLKTQGKIPDWDLRDLNKLYEDVSLVNLGLIERFKKILIKDTSLNALSTLDCFAQSISISLGDLNTEMLDELGLLSSLFKAYISE